MRAPPSLTLPLKGGGDRIADLLRWQDRHTIPFEGEGIGSRSEYFRSS